jgi:hypothetical protein
MHVLVPAAAVFVCVAVVTIMTGGRNYQIGSFAGVAQIAGAVVGLYAMSWLVTGTFYLLSFGRMD